MRQSDMRYVFVVVDYATRIVLQQAKSEARSWRVLDFVRRQIINMWGHPRVLYFDNGKQFTGAVFPKRMK
jgi:hypothetical protein